MNQLRDPVTKPAIRSPFKLLDYYVEADADIFGGREREIFEITAALASRDILVLYGPAGVGKTSLIQAGVFPAVRRLGWSCVHVRTLTNPLIDLTTAIADQLDLTINRSGDSTGIVKAIDAIAKKTPLLIAFDQFEEFFIRFENNADLRNAFISIIADLASAKKSTAASCSAFARIISRSLTNSSCRASSSAVTGSDRCPHSVRARLSPDRCETAVFRSKRG